MSTRYMTYIQYLSLYKKLIDFVIKYNLSLLILRFTRLQKLNLTNL